MQYLLMFILVGWLAVVGVGAEPEWDEPTGKNLNDLNSFLDLKLPENYDRAANLAQIRSDSAEMEPGVRRAAKLVLTMLERPTEECSNELMSALLALRKARLNTKPVNHLSRVEALLWTSWNEALDLCQAYIETSYKDSPVDLIAFSRAFNKQRHLGSYEREHRQDVDHYLNKKLRQLAKESPEFKIIFWTEKKFNKAFDELFKKPCSLIIRKTNVLDNVAAVTLADSMEWAANKGSHFSVNINTQLDNLNWARKVCTTVLTFGSTRIFKAWRPK